MAVVGPTQSAATRAKATTLFSLWTKEKDKNHNGMPELNELFTPDSTGTAGVRARLVNLYGEDSDTVHAYDAATTTDSEGGEVVTDREAQDIALLAIGVLLAPTGTESDVTVIFSVTTLQDQTGNDRWCENAYAVARSMGYEGSRADFMADLRAYTTVEINGQSVTYQEYMDLMNGKIESLTLPDGTTITKKDLGPVTADDMSLDLKGLHKHWRKKHGVTAPWRNFKKISHGTETISYSLLNKNISALYSLSKSRSLQEVFNSRRLYYNPQYYDDLGDGGVLALFTENAGLTDLNGDGRVDFEDAYNMIAGKIAILKPDDPRARAWAIAQEIGISECEYFEDSPEGKKILKELEDPNSARYKEYWEKFGASWAKPLPDGGPSPEQAAEAEWARLYSAGLIPKKEDGTEMTKDEFMQKQKSEFLKGRLKEEIKQKHTVRAYTLIMRDRMVSQGSYNARINPNVFYSRHFYVVQDTFNTMLFDYMVRGDAALDSAKIKDMSIRIKMDKIKFLKAWADRREGNKKAEAPTKEKPKLAPSATGIEHKKRRRGGSLQDAPP